MPKKKKISNSRNDLILIVGIVVLIIIGLSLLFFNNVNNSKQVSRTPNISPVVTVSPTITNKVAYPTTYISDMLKTYTNNEYAYSFQYPSNLILTEEKEQGNINFQDGSKRPLATTNYYFSTDQIVDGQKDYWGFSISTYPAYGDSISKIYGNLETPSGKAEITPVESQGAEEAASISNTTSVMVLRNHDQIFTITYFQHANAPYDLDINQQLNNVVNSIKFSQ